MSLTRMYFSTYQPSNPPGYWNNNGTSLGTTSVHHFRAR
jgi:hypothetical protein